MISFILKRLLWMVLTLWVVFTASFFLMRAVEGGPFSSERELDPQIEANIRARYNLDDPIIVQYWTHLTNTCRLDLGPSYSRVDFTVNEIIAQGFPISASLGILAMTFAMTLGTAAGIISAVYRGSTADFSLMSIATIGIALPNFVVAGILIILLVFMIPIFPAAGWGSLKYLILPSFCLGAPYAAYIARLMRTGLLDVLGQDYIRTAIAKGLPKHKVILKHAMRGAILPVVSFLGPAIAGILTGSLVVEKIFNIPGMGAHFIEAATQRDYTLAMGLVLLYCALLYTMNMLVDISYALIDPRVKLE